MIQTSIEMRVEVTEATELLVIRSVKCTSTSTQSAKDLWVGCAISAVAAQGQIRIEGSTVGAD